MKSTQSTSTGNRGRYAKTDDVRRWFRPRKTSYDYKRDKKPVINVIFTQELFDKILAEARSRQVSFGWMVRHLCEASIEGIE